MPGPGPVYKAAEYQRKTSLIRGYNRHEPISRINEMAREDYSDILGFIAVARLGSFTRAAAQLGISQSALSQAVRGLEERLGLRLLTRTTRKVSPTEVGERLLATVAPRFEEIETELAALSEMRDKPAGTVRITTADHAADTILLPKLAPLLREYPDLHLEIDTNYGMVDIVENRFDAGVRLGEQVAKDMIAMRIGPDTRMIVVGAPSYLAQRSVPFTPQELTDHTCINLRLPTLGGLYTWEFEKDGQKLNVRVEGQLVLNGMNQIVDAALKGVGLATMLEDVVAPYVADGRLVRVLDDWCPLFPGYHLYYPSRRQPSPAFALVLAALRYEGK
jgi:DNA-binding transcriptional LysR family regulator